MQTWLELLEEQSKTELNTITLPDNLPACPICKSNRYEFDVKYVVAITFPITATEDEINEASLNEQGSYIENTAVQCASCITHVAEVVDWTERIVQIYDLIGMHQGDS